MSAKGGSKNENKGNDDVKREQKLQAILLADSFTKTFRVCFDDVVFLIWENFKITNRTF